MTNETTGSFDELLVPSLVRRGGKKWSGATSGVIDASIGDMDFPISPAIAHCISDLATSSALGYPDWPRGESPLREAFSDRMARLYHWRADAANVREHTDLMQAIQISLELSTSVLGPVAVQLPGQPGILAAIRSAGRTVLPIHTVIEQGRYVADIGRLIRDVERTGCAMMILINPHNPTGMSMAKEQLRELALLASKFDMLVVSDEVYGDLTLPGRKHIPFASLGEDAARRTVTLYSASKSFNIAGLRTSVAHYGPRQLLARRDARPPYYYGSVSTIGVTATVDAWRSGDQWRSEIIATLARNREIVRSFLSSEMPEVRYINPDAGYFSWVDLSRLRAASPGPDPAAVIEQTARLRLTSGAGFGPGFEDFVRINFATSDRLLREILRRLREVFQTVPSRSR